MHVKYYKIADITVEVRSDLPIADNTFHPKFRQFETDKPFDEKVVIQHHFNGIPHFKENGVSRRIYFRPPWAIYKDRDTYIYDWIRPSPPYENYDKKAIANEKHSHIDIYHDEEGKNKFASGALTSLAMFPTDQIWLSRFLSNVNGCIIHSLGSIINGRGYLFVGHSDAGKSTMANILMRESIILCDDRNIIRKHSDGFMVYGTWSHGDVPNISPMSAPLEGIFFLEKSDENKLTRVQNNADALKILLACLIRPMTTIGWWNRSMDLITEILKTTPCRKLHFDKSGGALDLLKKLSLGQHIGNV